jgi:hypothetical protein
MSLLTLLSRPVANDTIAETFLLHRLRKRLMMQLQLQRVRMRMFYLKTALSVLLGAHF